MVVGPWNQTNQTNQCRHTFGKRDIPGAAVLVLLLSDHPSPERIQHRLEEGFAAWK